MPQMSPLNWLLLSFYFILIYLISMILVFFIVKFSQGESMIQVQVKDFFVKWY
uniref:ATP synthase F0 subunit 8 n=1 Tax=Euurobracon breviterebrae TaxID=1421601 RepID=A0A0A6ZKW0_9HYME|nr:ATP synthase F0 subunit 8 [Euurobracon breviterebrae]